MVSFAEASLFSSIAGPVIGSDKYCQNKHRSRLKLILFPLGDTFGQSVLPFVVYFSVIIAVKFLDNIAYYNIIRT